MHYILENKNGLYLSSIRNAYDFDWAMDREKALKFADKRTTDNLCDAFFAGGVKSKRIMKDSEQENKETQENE